MTVERDPVDRVLDLVVAIPVCSLVAARRAVPVVARALRSTVAAAGAPRVGPPVAPASAEAPVTRALSVTGSPAIASDPEPAAEPDLAGVLPDALPIAGYDHLAARQILDRLASLDADELGVVADYERTHRARSTVLARLEQLGA